jgi:arylformamidase
VEKRKTKEIIIFMKASINFKNQNYTIDLSNPLDIALPLQDGPENVTAWYCAPPRFEAVMTEHFTGDVRLGGAVNFRDVYFNPHGHGTHTECVGHIAEDFYSLRDCLLDFNMPAQLISISPELKANGDRVITAAQIAKALLGRSAVPALIIRTLPNQEDKLSYQYSNTNPAYIEAEAMRLIVAAEIEHLMIDTPSVDREEDGGALISHHIFWNYPEEVRENCTISELVFVPNDIKDGYYWLQLGVAAFENDAAPSRPLLYKLL